MTVLKLENLHKSFGETQALAGVSFEVGKGEIVAVLGPSGCGKSTLLAVIAGLETPEAGRVLWDGEDLASVPPHKRGFGLMFQDYALFPHMDVAANVAFGLEMAGMGDTAVARRVKAVLELVGLPDFAGRDVNNLSGGEQQRVALARSLAPEPRLLMLDEPLGSLDRTLRERLLLELKAILKRARQTTLYVTHDQEEAFALADRVVVMRAGTVAQVGTPQAIYRQPASLFVARFLGFTNLLPGVVRQKGGRAMVETAIGAWPVEGELQGEVTVLLRPDAVRLGAGSGAKLTGTLTAVTFRGNSSQAKVEVGGVELQFEFLANQRLPEVGENIQVSFDPQEALRIYPRED